MALLSTLSDSFVCPACHVFWVVFCPAKRTRLEEWSRSFEDFYFFGKHGILYKKGKEGEGERKETRDRINVMFMPIVKFVEA